MFYNIVDFICIRVESAYWSLKKEVGSSMGDMCMCWDVIHNVMILQHNEIPFEKSLNLISDTFKHSKYKRFVSKHALNLIVKEFN